jgi:hypothetical protein
MGKLTKDKKIIILLVFLGLLIGLMASAQGKSCRGLVSWPRSPAGTDINPTLRDGKCVFADLPTLIKYLYEWGIGLGGLAAFVALVIAGFQYLTSAGEPAKMKEAMDRIKSAALGLVLLLATWVILNTINPALTTLQLPSPELAVEAMSGLECKTSLDCPTGYKCVCVKGKGKREGTAINPCLLKAETEEPGGICFPREDLVEGTRCTKAVYGFNKLENGVLHYITGGEIEMGEIQDLKVPIEGGTLLWAQGYIGDEICGPDAIWGQLSKNCQECSEGNNKEACKKCCLSCYAELRFYSAKGGNFEVNSYVLLNSVSGYPIDVDVHSIGMFAYQTFWEKLTPPKPTVWEAILPHIFLPRVINWIKDLKDLF